MQRIDKLLTSTGRWSRKESRMLVRQGRVCVDGAVAQRAEDQYDETAAVITVDKQPVNTAPFVYFMLHKPAGVLSATEDARQKTVLDLLEEADRRRGLFPVGRLDKDTEGLLLLTDDGALGHALLSPKRHVDKVYYAQVDGVLQDDDVLAFVQGLTLADGMVCMSAGLQILEQGRAAYVTLREGKYHQIKRMLASVGKPVIYLKRIQMGALTLDPLLEKGAYRPLTEEELNSLRDQKLVQESQK